MNRKAIEDKILADLESDFEDRNLNDEFFGPRNNGLSSRDRVESIEQELGKLNERDREALNEAMLVAPQSLKRVDEKLAALGPGGKFQYGVDSAFTEGKVDHQKAFWDARSTQDLDIEAPRIQQLLGTNPSLTRTMDLIGLSNPADRASREAMGLGLMKDPYARTGQMVGTALSDLNQDRFRSLWWLLNAPQAVASVVNEATLAHQVPGLYAQDKQYNDAGDELLFRPDDYQELSDKELINFVADPKVDGYKAEVARGVSKVEPSSTEGIEKGYKALSKRRYRPGNVDLLGLPASIAINAGVGLLNPLGGSNGYSAVFESDDDPTRTSNVVGEVAAKYILGRTGQMLPWDEFKKVRPDVSKGEYMKYKAFKYDKEGDFDLSDGDFTVPTGFVKGTMEGIHGPEIQFLGRSMPLLTTLMPVGAATVGTTLGAKWQPEKFNQWDKDHEKIRSVRNQRIESIKKNYKNEDDRNYQIREANSIAKKTSEDLFKARDKVDRQEYLKINRVRNGVVAGLASYAAAAGAGLLLENERRRRNELENGAGHDATGQMV